MEEIAAHGSTMASWVAPPIEALLETTALIIGLLAAAVLLWGVGRGFVLFLRLEWDGRRNQALAKRRETLRRTVAFYLLLGLELLVAADIVETILTPSVEHVVVLGSVVVIRTVISFSLSWELSRGEIGADPEPPSSTPELA